MSEEERQRRLVRASREILDLIRYERSQISQEEARRLLRAQAEHEARAHPWRWWLRECWRTRPRLVTSRGVK